MVLTTPLYRLDDTSSRRTVGALAWQAVGGVGVVCGDVTGGAVEFADVLREVPAVGWLRLKQPDPEPRTHL